MKITKGQLKEIIREEIQKMRMDEGPYDKYDTWQSIALPTKNVGSQRIPKITKAKQGEYSNYYRDYLGDYLNELPELLTPPKEEQFIKDFVEITDLSDAKSKKMFKDIYAKYKKLDHKYKDNWTDVQWAKWLKQWPFG